MDIFKNAVLFYGVLLILLLNTESTSGQIGLDWNKLEGEEAGGMNNTSDVDDIQDSLLDIWKQLQKLVPNFVPNGTLPDLPDFLPGGGDGNATFPFVPGTGDGKGPAFQFPPGLEALVNVSPKCQNDTVTLVQDYLDGKRYARQMISSGGSVTPDPSTEFTGLLFDPGLFDTCRDVKAANEETPFDAQYCIASVYLPQTTGYHIGQCMPASCSIEDLYIIIYTLKPMVPQLKDIDIGVYCENPIPFNGADIFVIFLCAVLAAFMCAGTLYHLIIIHIEAREKNLHKTYESPPEEEEEAVEAEENKAEDGGAAAAEGKTDDAERAQMNIQEDDKPSDAKKAKAGKCGRVLMCFSVIHNFKKIFDTSQQKGTLGALNGLRVISMFWIIIGHSWQFLATYRADNPIRGYTVILNKFWFQTILGGPFAVDTFFLLSGLLLGYLTMKALKKGDGKLNWGLFFFHRYYRITPLYMFVLGVWATLPVHIGNGPGKLPFFNGARDQCKQYWWANLLYINNLYPFPGDLGAMCIGWSWYLANDMQFFWISPIILILLYKNRKIGFAVIGALLLVSYFSTIGITIYYGLTAGINQTPFNNRTVDNPTADHLYAKPYHRIPPYLIGIAIGYMLFKLEGKKFVIPKLVSAACWVGAAGMAIGVVFGLYSTAQGHQLSQGATVFYHVMNATAWGLAIGWVAFACIKGYGGPVNTMLSWSIWTPLARITFGAYLVHPMIQFWYIFSLKTPVPISMSLVTFHAIAFIVVSYATSLLFSLALEAPLMGLEKLMFKRK